VQAGDAKNVELALEFQVIARPHSLRRYERTTGRVRVPRGYMAVTWEEQDCCKMRREPAALLTLSWAGCCVDMLKRGLPLYRDACLGL
jgi:hypothetical protein